MMRLDLIIPLLILLGGAVLVLVIGIFLPRQRQTWSAGLAGAVIIAAVMASVTQFAQPAVLVFGGSYAADYPALWTQLVLLLGAFLCLILSIPAFNNDAREGEYYALLLFNLLGAMLLAAAADVMEIVLGVLLTSVGGYVLVAYRRSHRQAMEAVLKYYLIGALSNIGLIYGLVLLYGLSGSTLTGEIGSAVEPANTLTLAVALTLVLVGLGFKAGYVPTHFWIPDVYQGATVPVAALLSVLPKVAALLAVARLVSAFPAENLNWPLLIAGLAAVTMTWGNLAAFRQNDIRRLLGYSSISQSGYLLMGVAALPQSSLALGGLLYYFAAYTAANLGAFAVLGATGHSTIEHHAGLVRRSPGTAYAMAIALLSLMGLPPLAGFVAKFVLFTASFQAGYAWLTVVALINTVLSLYYYLRVIGPMFLQPPQSAQPPVEGFGNTVALTGALASIILGIGAFFLLDLKEPMVLLH
jgi:NADH-quinone oxidoreductase subunit N